MFGLDNNEKELKELLAQMGCEASVFKNFKNGYEKMEKNRASVSERYASARRAGGDICLILESVEKAFTEGKAVDFSQQAKELKRLQGSANHEFLVSPQDREFHSTYETLVKKLPELQKGNADKLLMHSEVENLLSMMREKLEFVQPNLHAYAYFLIAHKDAELVDFNAESKCEHIKKIYIQELISPVINAVSSCGGGEAFMPRFNQLFASMTGGRV